MTTTRIGVLAQANQALQTDADPDGPDALGALMLATDTAMAAAASPVNPDRWAFAGIALAEARDRLTDDRTDTLTLSVDPMTVDADTVAQALPPMRDLVSSLADLYRRAAEQPSASPWRRLAWADAAQDLERAVAELT